MQGDIYATKGVEYLLVIGYLLLLVATLRLLVPRLSRKAAAQGGRPRLRPASWFALAEDYYFHPAHTWAAEGGGDVLTVGLDDFAAQLVGAPDGLELPAVGTVVRQGERAWQVRAGDRTLPMLSPVDGRVVAVNAAVRDAPRLAAEDPYGEGWLLKVEAPDHRRTSLRNLLSGELASVWMRHTVERLRRLPAGELGVVMPDGGVPVRGFGRALAPEEWDAVTREFFRTD
jgi:glycine cleavage system H lipoate-binding protein